MEEGGDEYQLWIWGQLGKRAVINNLTSFQVLWLATTRGLGLTEGTSGSKKWKWCILVSTYQILLAFLLHPPLLGRPVLHSFMHVQHDTSLSFLCCHSLDAHSNLPGTLTHINKKGRWVNALRQLSTSWGQGRGHWWINAFPFYFPYEMYFISLLRRILRIQHEPPRVVANLKAHSSLFYSPWPLLLLPEITWLRFCFPREARPRHHLHSYNCVKNQTGFLIVFWIYLSYISSRYSTICILLQFSEGKYCPCQSKNGLKRVRLKQEPFTFSGLFSSELSSSLESFAVGVM